jgi:hypothetical protein
VAAREQKAPDREPFSVRRIGVIAITALSAVYLLQAVTPLRLDDDALDYLNVATALADGRATPHLPIPHGYPWIVALLDRAHLGSSAFFVLANCCFLAIGLGSIWRMHAYTRTARIVAIIASLFAIPVIKSVPIALPDAAFFGVFFLALLLMSSEHRSGYRSAIATVSAAMLIIIAIDLRYAGIALLGPLAWSLFHSEREGVGSGRRTRLLIPGSLLAATLVWMVMSSNLLSLYAAQAHDYYGNGSFIGRIWDRAFVLLRSIGEIVVNLPFSRFRTFGWAYAIVGFVTVALGAGAVRRPFALNAQRACLVSYLLLIAIWPSPAPRLFIPIIPLAAAEATELFFRKERPRWVSLAAGTFGVWFALTGAAALAYTTRISLSGSNFTRVYGKNGGMPDPDIHEGDPSWSHVQYYRKVAPVLLQRYGDSRARGK